MGQDHCRYAGTDAGPHLQIRPDSLTNVEMLVSLITQVDIILKFCHLSISYYGGHRQRHYSIRLVAIRFGYIYSA